MGGGSSPLLMAATQSQAKVEARTSGHTERIRLTRTGDAAIRLPTSSLSVSGEQHRLSINSLAGIYQLQNSRVSRLSQSTTYLKQVCTRCM